jgi:hypothetical protein
VANVIGFLRFIGVMNAAVWLGGGFFLMFGTSPAISSPAMQALLGDRYFSYFSAGIENIALARFYHFEIVCALIAFLHLIAEWLYLGRPSRRRFSVSLLVAFFLVAFIGSNVLQPRLRALHTTTFSRSAQPAERQAAARSYRVWDVVTAILNYAVMGGLVVYLWRVANPSDTPRFISSVKFRG